MLGPAWLDATAVAGSLTWSAQVTSWLGAEWLGDLPDLISGQVTWSAHASEAPGVLNVDLPRYALGADWSPGRDARHPLSHHGQELVASLTVGSPVSGRSWTRRLGRFLIEETQTRGGTVTVQARSLTQRLHEDRLTAPLPARGGATLASEARRIVPARLGLVIHPDLVDRRAPTIAWGDSRMEALEEIAAAWPARIRETPDGQIILLPPLPVHPSPVITLTDGEGGTVVEAPRTATRRGIYNRVVARGTDEDEDGRPTVQVVEDQADGPLAAAGPYGTVTRFFASPLISTYPAALASARTMLANSIRQSSIVPVTCAPDPRLELDDAVRLLTADGDDTGYISGLTLPLTVSDGDMRLDVEVGA